MSVVNQDMQALIQKSSGIETITPLKLKAKTKHFEMDDEFKLKDKALRHFKSNAVLKYNA